MKEIEPGEEFWRPILFTTAMVRELLSGAKSQTRRVVKLTPELKWLHGDLSKAFPDPGFGGFGYLHVPCPEVRENGVFIHDATVQRLYCPYADGPGNSFLWVKETWSPFFKRSDNNNGCMYLADFGYRAGLVSEKEARKQWKWKPSIFMPRWASRISLKVTGVRAERLQDISDDDIALEGFSAHDGSYLARAPESMIIDGARVNMNDRIMVKGMDRIAFANGWDAINGKRPGCSFECNPWVWRIQFEVMK